MISIGQFSTEHIADAARLFAAVYSRHCSDNTLLPNQFANPHAIEPLLATIARDNPGAVALSGSEVAGYLIGHMGISGFFGHGVGAYVPIFGHCMAPSLDPIQPYAALYTHLSTIWVDHSCHSQAVTYFVDSQASTESLEATLFGLGFGLQTIDAVRPAHPIAAAIDDITLQPASTRDLQAVEELDRKLRTHLRAAPIFLNTHPVAQPDLEENFFREGVKTFIAWREGAPIAGIRAVLNAGPGCELLNVPGSLGINFAYTDIAFRGADVGTALLNAALKWGSDNGMVRCVVDFESANHAARHFWQRHFRAVFHSAVRRVDDRMP